MIYVCLCVSWIIDADPFGRPGGRAVFCGKREDIEKSLASVGHAVPREGAALPEG